MLNLDNITLICIDCIELERAEVAIRRSIKHINFGSVKLLTSLKPKLSYSFIYPISPIKSKREYSEFIIKELYKWINTSHCLIVQWDGFPINIKAWTDEFLQYDYIGGIWDFRPDIKVGNGGFSLRSRRLCELTATLPEITRIHPEDDTICIVYRDLLISHGIKFAPEYLARKFSLDGQSSLPYKGAFGYHGGIAPKV
jgi:hypothetical protein